MGGLTELQILAIFLACASNNAPSAQLGEYRSFRSAVAVVRFIMIAHWTIMIGRKEGREGIMYHWSRAGEPDSGKLIDPQQVMSA